MQVSGKGFLECIVFDGKGIPDSVVVIPAEMSMDVELESEEDGDVRV